MYCEHEENAGEPCEYWAPSLYEEEHCLYCGGVRDPEPQVVENIDPRVHGPEPEQEWEKWHRS